MFIKRPKPFLVQIALAVSIFWQNTNAGLEDLPVGARSIGMGATYVALANTADAIFLNPGGLSQLNGAEISVFYQRPFGLPDLNFGMVAASFAFRSHRLGIGFLQFGNRLYNEQVLAFTYSRSYQQKLHWGLGLKYQALRIEGYGSAATIGLDFGFVVPLARQLNLGFVVKNLNRPSIGESDERVPQTFRIGVSARPNPKIILNVEVFKDTRFAEEIRFGAEITPIPRLALRAGTANNPSRFSTGFGIRVDQVNLDYAFFTHSDLGLTHQMSVSIAFAEGKSGLEDDQPVGIKPETVTLQQADDRQQPQRAGEKININLASVAELTKLPGIGNSLATAIVEYREANGPFEAAADLLKVPGIGNKKLASIKELITVSKP